MPVANKPDRAGAGRRNSEARSRRRTIGQAAQEAGVHVETIRYYERIGLLARPVARGSYREYSAEAVARVRFIKQAQQLGFTLREIGELAGMADAAVSCAQMCASMEEKAAALDAEIVRLTRQRDQLRELIKASPQRGSYTNCAAFGKMAGVAGCDASCK